MGELERFIEFWLGPRQESYGEPESAFQSKQLPDPLARFYRFAGRWPTVSRDYPGSIHAFSTQDTLLGLGAIESTPDGRVLFAVENQGVWRCVTLAQGANPPVWVSGEARGLDDKEWVELEVPLIVFLGGFVMQELAMGSRVCSGNRVLDSALRPRLANISPFWNNAPHVYGDNRSFTLLDEGILVFRMGQSYWYAANSERGIAAIENWMGGISHLTLSIPSGWNLEISVDGSGTLRLFGRKDTKGEFPPGTFQFEEVRDAFLAESDDKRQPYPEYFIFPRRAGDGFARGRGLLNLRFAREAFTKAIQNVSIKEPLFDAAIRKIILP